MINPNIIIALFLPFVVPKANENKSNVDKNDTIIYPSDESTDTRIHWEKRACPAN